jgi:hypothetical protein
MRKPVSALAITCFLGICPKALAESGKTPPPPKAGASAAKEADSADAIEITTSRVLFDAADRDADGTVTFGEFAALVEDSVTRRVAERFKQLDRNRDGFCARSEVNKMSSARFARFDRNRDGFFTMTELGNALKAQLTGRLAQVYAKLDLDRDGRFSVAELTLPTKPAEPTKTARRQVASAGFGTSN